MAAEIAAADDPNRKKTISVLLVQGWKHFDKVYTID
jgi:hypothetical protein